MLRMYHACKDALNIIGDISTATLNSSSAPQVRTDWSGLQASSSYSQPATSPAQSRKPPQQAPASAGSSRPPPPAPSARPAPSVPGDQDQAIFLLHLFLRDLSLPHLGDPRCQETNQVLMDTATTPTRDEDT